MNSHIGKSIVIQERRKRRSQSRQQQKNVNTVSGKQQSKMPIGF